MSRDTWGGDYNRPMSLNKWMYGYANPIMYVDPSGNISCEDSSDPACIAVVSALTNYGRGLKSSVSEGWVEPVEALAFLADKAYSDFGKDLRGFMWGMTILLLGIDPNTTEHDIWTLGMAEDYRPDNSPYSVGLNWLPYLKPDTSLESEIGDWDPDIFDGSSNQAFHFWYFAAVTYYDAGIMAFIGNQGHDPHYLEGILGDDLEKCKDLEGNIIYDGLNEWSQHTANTNRQDWNLSNRGIAFANQIISLLFIEGCNFGDCDHIPSPDSVSTVPGTWIRANLKNKGN